MILVVNIRFVQKAAAVLNTPANLAAFRTSQVHVLLLAHIVVYDRINIIFYHHLGML